MPPDALCERMNPVLFHIGVRPVSSYSAVMGVTLLATLLSLILPARRTCVPVDKLSLLTLAAGLAGARLGHVLANLSYYREHWPALFDLRDGGLVFISGAATGLAALAFSPWPAGRAVSPRQRLHSRLALLSLPVSIALFGGWLACLLAGCGYGLAIDPPQRWFTFDWPDNFGVRAFRLPTQALGMALALLLILLRRHLARLPGLFLLLLGSGQWLVQATRGDLLQWGPLAAAQWLNLGIIVLGAWLLLRTPHPAR